MKSNIANMNSQVEESRKNEMQFVIHCYIFSIFVFNTTLLQEYE